MAARASEVIAIVSHSMLVFDSLMLHLHGIFRTCHLVAKIMNVCVCVFFPTSYPEYRAVGYKELYIRHKDVFSISKMAA